MLMRKLGMLITLVVIISLNSKAQEVWKWHAKPATIETRWGKKVNPDLPLAEYPRPQMERANWVCLNGLWDYAIIDDQDSQPFAFDGKILVPYPIESSLSGVKRTLMPYQALWYHRSFTTSTMPNGKKMLLNFGAVDYSATVYINGTKVCEHSGGYTAFTCDITAFLNNGNNELLIKVIDPTDQGIGPHGKQVIRPGEIYYTGSSGIWQTVWLESVSDTYVSDMQLIPNIDKRQLDLVVNLGNDSVPHKCEIEVNISKDIKVRGEPGKVIHIPIKNMHLWSPEDPFLYDFSVRVTIAGEEVDRVRSYFGMRKISIEKDKKGQERIFLNNKYYYNLGVLDQGYWPDGLYTAPTDDALAFDVKVHKLMGFNTIRKHIKIEPARWYYHADKIGMLVWQDFVNPNKSLSDDAKSAFETQVLKVVKQLHNVPSITTWVIFNEKWGQYDQQRITEWIKRIDPTRIVNGHSGELLYVNNQLRSPSPNAYVSSDVTDIHSYPSPRSAPYMPGKARVLGEFGGLGVSVEGHSWDDLNSGWGYSGLLSADELKRTYQQMADSLVLLEKDGLSGSIYTQPFDVEFEQNGILTYDRKVIKIPFDTIRKINARIWQGISQKEAATLGKGVTLETPRKSEKSYKDNLIAYQNGRRDSSFLRALAVNAKKNKDEGNMIKISNDYLCIVKDHFSELNLRFIHQFTRNNNDIGFKFLIQNIDSIDKLPLGVDLSKMARGIIQREINIDKRENMDQFQWDVLKKEMQNKYGSQGELTLLEDMALYYYLKKDISRFVDIKSEIHEKHPNAVSVFDMNNDAWAVFENTADTSLLATAIKWSQKVIKMEPTSNYYDTYANLLYRIGKRELAIQKQEEGLKLSTGNGLLEDVVRNLEKMKKGEPTWK
jgi:hypothetical protein